MTKNDGSKLIWLILGLVPLLFIACGGSAATVPVLEEAVEMEEMEGETAVSHCLFQTHKNTARSK